MASFIPGRWDPGGLWAEEGAGPGSGAHRRPLLAAAGRTDGGGRQALRIVLVQVGAQEGRSGLGSPNPEEGLGGCSWDRVGQTAGGCSSCLSDARSQGQGHSRLSSDPPLLPPLPSPTPPPTALRLEGGSGPSTDSCKTPHVSEAKPAPHLLISTQVDIFSSFSTKLFH